MHTQNKPSHQQHLKRQHHHHHHRNRHHFCTQSWLPSHHQSYPYWQSSSLPSPRPSPSGCSMPKRMMRKGSCIRRKDCIRALTVRSPRSPHGAVRELGTATPSTHQKTTSKMESENCSFDKETHLPNLHFGFHISVRVYIFIHERIYGTHLSAFQKQIPNENSKGTWKKRSQQDSCHTLGWLPSRNTTCKRGAQSFSAPYSSLIPPLQRSNPCYAKRVHMCMEYTWHRWKRENSKRQSLNQLPWEHWPHGRSTLTL